VNLRVIDLIVMLIFGAFLQAIETIEEKWVNFQNDKMI